jgi:serine-type D-Ala-D-Ala carboxypeptidase (penicillin-binding protein 5/6)
MKHLALILLVSVLFAPPAWGARAKVTSMAKDPYVSALVIDANSGKVLFAEQADTVTYPASVLKLMNLLIILKQVEQGKIKLSDMVQVTPEAAKTGGSQVYLDPKEQFPLEELLYALAVQSANDAAVALAIHIGGSKEGFVALMNQQAAELGMKSTRFHSVHGLPPAQGQKPDETTAADLALLCRELAKRPDAFKYTGTKERPFRDNTFIMRNHNHLLGSVEGVDGFKTGYYEAAGFSIAASAARGGVRIIAIVMGSKDRKVRDAKTRELLAKGFTMVPPKAAVPGAAVPATAGAAKKVEPPAATTAPAPPVSAPVSEVVKEEPAPVPGRDWSMFFWGLVLGVIAVVVPAFVLLQRRDRVR